jgi:hypothetical protein
MGGALRAFGCHFLDVILALEARIQSRQPNMLRLLICGWILGTSPSMTMAVDIGAAAHGIDAILLSC